MPNGKQRRQSKSREWFRKAAHKCAESVGTPLAFSLAVLVIVVWAALGPVFRYSDTWQLVVNTATTIVTFLMVFLIQNAQNRDSKAIHLKLDELLRAVKGARNELANLEDMSDEELEKLHEEFRHLHEHVHAKVTLRRQRWTKKDSPP